MGFDITIPFYAFQLHFSTGGRILTPMNDKNAFRMGMPLQLVAGQYAELLQRKVLNQGQFRELLDEYREGEFLRSKVQVVFPEAADGISYPEFSLEFDFFYSAQPQGYWGIVPVLGVESFGRNERQLTTRLEEAIKLDFARGRRLRAVQEIISAIWFNQVELNQHEIGLKTPRPREVENLGEEEQEKLLPQAAQVLYIERRVVYGRKKELEQFARALKSDFNRNVLLVGPSGVGKTALVWELARQEKKRRIKGPIWETTASTLIKELTRQTGWQDNLAILCQELATDGGILFVRNLMELFEVGKYEGNEVSLADFLRTYLSRGEVTLITECTEEELARIELKSPNYLSVFQIIRLQEPEAEQLEKIILKKTEDLAHDRRIEISEEAVREVIRLNRRFIPYAGMPGRPIRFLESILINKKGEMAQKQDYTLQINRSEVIRYFCEDTGMPLFMVDPAVPMDVEAIRRRFNENIFGQEKAVDSLVDTLASVKTALTRTGKPIASFLFAGPTGVGKTEMAKQLAEFMFGARDRMIRFDMSEYASPYAVMRLTGSDYFSDGVLTSAVRREPFCVLLFDEIEKAHPNFYDLLLQLLSEGRLTDSQGKLVNFCSSIIIMTSNIGASNLQTNRISFSKDQRPEFVIQHFISAVEKYFRPELFNRIDEIIPFAPLDPLTVRFVVERELSLLRRREGIRFRRLDLQVDEAVYEWLAQKGYDSRYGARQLQRTLRQELVIPLSRALNQEDPDDQLLIRISVGKGGLDIQCKADPLGLELLLEELEKIQQADFASALRREINRLQEGSVFVRLQSEIDILERRKRGQGKKFWHNEQQAERYAYLLETGEKVKKMAAEISVHEMELATATLDVNTYDPSRVEAMLQWEKDFFELKVEIYSRLEPSANQCHLSLYGRNLAPVVPFYLELLTGRGYEFSISSVWFREKYYHEEVVDFNPESNGLDMMKREAYIKKIVSATEALHPLPPEEGDLFCGLEFAISGNCAFLYLHLEKGNQRWKLSENEDYLCAVKVDNFVQPTPRNIHRRDFYTREPVRRIVEPPNVRDTLYKINREYQRGQLHTLLQESLDTQFEALLNAEVL